MYREKSSKLFVKYAVPQMIGLLLNSVYLIVDGIFIGNRLGRDAMAAAAISVPVIEILIALSLLVATGAGILISARLGEKEEQEANRLFNLSVAMLAVMSVIIAILGNLFLNPLAMGLGATPDIHGDAVTYLWYIVTFSPFLLFSFLLSGLARNDNRPKLAMTALAVGSCTNIVLDYIFMYPLDMGIAGAALATALGPIFSVLILLPHFLRRKGYLYFAKLRKVTQGVRQIVTLGAPDFVMEFSIGIVTFIYNYAIVKHGYGELGLAAYLIIGYIMLIILTLFLGIAQGLQPIFSYYHGAGEKSRSRDLLRFATKIVLGVGVLCYLLVLLFAPRFIAVFTPGDPELHSFTDSRALIYFCGFLFAGYNVLMIAYWLAERRTGAALLLSLLRSVILLPVLILVLPLIWGSEVIWLCHWLAEAISSGCAFGLKRIQRSREHGALEGKSLSVTEVKETK